MIFPGAFRSDATKAEFGISYEEHSELFDEFGCRNARTAKAAARYIRAFVKRRQQAAAKARRSKP